MERLYKHREEIHNTRSAELVVPLIVELVRCKSVLDVGCGTGTWLKVFQMGSGIEDILGIDGEYVHESQLVIDPAYFMKIDLRNGFDTGRTFDLAVCLEVGEHLPESHADSLVASLCRHANHIVFSAAIPGQGGQNHLNEQWPDYWRKKFEILGYTCLDAIRPAIWNDDRVDIWYRQNMFLYSRDQTLIEQHSRKSVTAVIHPELWRRKIALLEKNSTEVNNFDSGGAGIMRSLKGLVNALGKFFFRHG